MLANTRRGYNYHFTLTRGSVDEAFGVSFIEIGSPLHTMRLMQTTGHDRTWQDRKLNFILESTYIYIY